MRIQELLFKTLEGYQRVTTKGANTATPFVLEPFGRNTAAAVAAAALQVQGAHGDEAVLLILPADHLITDQAAFAAAVAAEVAGPDAVDANAAREMGSEDFSYMLEARPGAYLFMGTGPGAIAGGDSLRRTAAVLPRAARWRRTLPRIPCSRIWRRKPRATSAVS